MTGFLPHICFVAPNAFPLLANEDVEIIGGPELQQVIIGKGLARRGYPVSMICLDFGQPDRLTIDGITVHRAYRPTAGLPVLRFLWPRLSSIWSCLARTNADIYYQRPAGVLTGVIAAYARRYGRKSIFAVAGEPMIRFARDRKIYEYGVRNVDCILVQNEAQKQLFAERFGRDSVLVPNCYQPEPPVGAAVRTDALWVSTIRRLKRPELFLDLAEAIPSRRFTMVGGRGYGEASLYDRIRARASKLPNVDFVGFVPYARVHQYFDGARVFVNTSETEGFPNTFLQAWARKVPTVSFIDCGAHWNGMPVGLIVNSPEQLVHTVKTLLEDQAECARAGAIGQQYVASHHATEAVLDRYEEVFRSLRDKH